MKIRKYHRASAMGCPGQWQGPGNWERQEDFQDQVRVKNSVENNRNPNILGVPLI